MKKIVLLLSVLVCISVFAGCGQQGTAVKSKNAGVEFNVSDKEDWEVLQDNEDSYIISNDDEMISYSVVDIDDNSVIPTTEEQLLVSLGEGVAAVSEISDFNYEVWNDSDTQILYYKQTITTGDTVTTIINRDVVTGNQRKNSTATLVNADQAEIERIADTIKNSN